MISVLAQSTCSHQCMLSVFLQCMISVRSFWDESKYPPVFYDLCILCVPVHHHASAYMLSLRDALQEILAYGVICMYHITP